MNVDMGQDLLMWNMHTSVRKWARASLLLRWVMICYCGGYHVRHLLIVYSAGKKSLSHFVFHVYSLTEHKKMIEIVNVCCECALDIEYLLIN